MYQTTRIRRDAGSDNNYVVVVRATSGTGSREKTATRTIVVTVTDELEPPDKPEPPLVSPASETSLDVRWLEPDNKKGAANQRLRLPVQEDERFGARLDGGDDHRIVGDDQRP